MHIELHNTLTRQREVFVPLNPALVRLYVCGPTVYDFAHLGNAVPVVFFDVLYRLLRRLYPQVLYVRNITDVDDKIMERAAQTGESISALTTRTALQYNQDMAALNCLAPDIQPLATEHIAEMLELIATLIAQGHAYEVEGQVLFHVPSMPDYGKLSRHSRDDLVAGARVDVAPYKRDPADFTLWKPSSPEQVGWDSPYGRGRPGWHIECSAMAKKHLGITFDIHGGGGDLIFPHHENEIAQSECAHHAPLARFWLHNGMLMVDGKKMAKSLGNFFTVRDLLAEAPGEAIRFALLQSHYRSPIDFSVAGLRVASSILDKFYRRLQNAPTQEDYVYPAVLQALCADLNTPAAITALHECPDNQLRASGALLGILQQEPDAWFKALVGCALTADEIEAQIASRLAARKARDFAKADAIRDALLAQGIILEDAAGGTSWRRA